MKDSLRTVLYPGTFDPVTNGHVDVVRRAVRLFDRVIVAVGSNTAKAPVFTVAERMAHLRLVCRDLPGVSVASFGGLLTDALHDFGAVAVIRGLRAVSDFEYEFQMALMNRELAAECETVFLMPSPGFSFVSSTMIREIGRLGGDIGAFVPPEICPQVRERFAGAGS
ncbi:MAG: pantetheine-phosphate adenylyltransferase [Lentisphaeria bacterium]|nr:pantetheine-phosphate adenylyltransferase [Lentisphaeria bacterium]